MKNHHRKTAAQNHSFTLIISMLVIILTACGEDINKSVSNSESHRAQSSIASSREASLSMAPISTPESSSSQREALSSNPVDAFVNEELLQLIGMPLSSLKDYGEDYYIYAVGDLSGAMEYYSPYVCFYFDPMNYFNPSGRSENSTEQDPFKRDDLPIKWIELLGEYDADTHSMTNQDSLRRLFITDELITYELLAEKLDQEPKLEYSPEGHYRTTRAFESGGGQWGQIEGGVYNADYTVNEENIRITFISVDEIFYAMQIDINPNL